jgi:glyoxylase I family protein
MPRPEFSHYALNCTDPIATERFYARHFGFERARVVPLGGSDQIVFLRSGSLHLELFQSVGAQPAPPATADGPAYAGWRHIAFAVPSVDAKLAEMGSDARVTHGPFGFDDFIPGWRSVWIADPDGNVIELNQGYVDQDAPPPLAG